MITTFGYLPASKVTLYTTASGCEASYNWPVPPVSDNCDGTPLLVVSGDNSSTFQPIMAGYQQAAFQLGTTIVTYTATDNCLNQSFVTFEVEVLDTVKPIIAGLAASVTVNNDQGQCRATVSWPAPTITDNCTGVSYTMQRSDGIPISSSVSQL